MWVLVKPRPFNYNSYCSWSSIKVGLFGLKLCDLSQILRFFLETLNSEYCTNAIATVDMATVAANGLIVQDFSIYTCVFNWLMSLIDCEILSSAISFVQKSKTIPNSFMMLLWRMKSNPGLSIWFLYATRSGCIKYSLLDKQSNNLP